MKTKGSPDSLRQGTHSGVFLGSVFKECEDRDRMQKVAYTVVELMQTFGMPCTNEVWERMMKVMLYCNITSREEALNMMYRLLEAFVEIELANGRIPVRLPLGSRGDSIDPLAYAGVVREIP